MTMMSDKLVDKLGSDYSERLRERRHFEADRVNEHGTRITYMAHGCGWVMARRPGCVPFTLMEKEWLVLPLYIKPASDKP